MPSRFRTFRLPSRCGGVLVLAGALAALSGCDFAVTNPGPVADNFLNDAGAYDAIVNAVGRNMNYAMNAAAIDTGLRSREIHALDRDDWRAVTYSAHIGSIRTDAPAYVNPWTYGQAARWVGEDGLRRFERELGADDFGSHPSVARGSLWTGYANRLLGDYFCEAVFDGGPALPGEEFHTRAEEQFTRAIAVANAAGLPDVATAAHAGRASVRVHLGDWAGAIADAGMVPTEFEFFLPYHSDGNWRYYNVFRMSGLPQDGAYTVWNTFYEDYYLETGDPRTPWEQSTERPTRRTSLEPWSGTELPFLVQLKYTDFGSDIRLSSGAEMRLVEAEALLRDGEIPAAMTVINAIRLRAGMDPWPSPGSLVDAWTLLKRERGIELWLEGRRLADFRRWRETSTPGELNPYELGLTNGGPDLTNAALCQPIPENEEEYNPNLD